MSDADWQPITTAPKSTVENGLVKGIYLLGYCPDEAISPEACISVIWWEPLMKHGRGCWYGDGDFEYRPTHWMPLPPVPKVTP